MLALPRSKAGILCFVFLLVPLALVATSFPLGALMAFLQDWPVMDGFLYIVGGLCGVVSPLNGEIVFTNGGYFVESLRLIVEFTAGGIVIGIIISHPAILGLVERIEGEPCMIGIYDHTRQLTPRDDKLEENLTYGGPADCKIVHLEDELRRERVEKDQLRELVDLLERELQQSKQDIATTEPAAPLVRDLELMQIALEHEHAESERLQVIVNEQREASKQSTPLEGGKARRTASKNANARRTRERISVEQDSIEFLPSKVGRATRGG